MLQKIYSLPNCHLVVEGLSTTEDKTLTLLTHFQCQVGGKTISGGKELLCNLIKGVSYACQLAIAGEGVDYQDTQVTIGSKGFQYYLTVAGEEGKVEVQLDRVQLFDLMEALDQLCLDPQTLPDVGLMFPSPKPPISSVNPLVPAVVGISSVVAVAVALWFVPIPQRRTEEVAQPPQQERVLPPPTPQRITDPVALEELRSKLFTLLDREWRNTITFPVPLTYTVTVNQDGAIIGYKETPQTRESLGEAGDEILQRMEEELPLEKLLRQNLDNQPRSIATFAVTFTTSGALEVNLVKNETP